MRESLSEQHKEHLVSNVHQRERRDTIKNMEILYSLHASLDVDSERRYSSCFDQFAVVQLTLAKKKRREVQLNSTRCKILHNVKPSVSHDRVPMFKQV